MRNIQQYCKWGGWCLSGIASLWIAAMGQATASPIFEQLMSPVRSTIPTGLDFYTDKSGALNLIYLAKQSQNPGDINQLIFDNSQWSSPVDVGLLGQNKRELIGVVNLSSGSPLILIKGDDTDYGALFGLSSAPPDPANESAPIIPGVDQVELETMLDDNQRLFYSFYANTSWSTPQPIAGTSRAENPVIAEGEQSGALVIFTQDADKNSLTISDRELYFSVLSNRFWSTPVRITNNSIAEFNVSIVYINGQYMVTWTTDEDNNANTRDDWKFRYTTIGLNGQLGTQQTVLNQNQSATVPILAQMDNQPVLFWEGAPESTDSPRRPIQISRFSTSWSAPEPIGLYSLQMVNGRLYASGGGHLLVYYDSGVVQAALNIAGVWHSAGTLADIQGAGYSLAELDHYYDQNNQLWIALSAHIPAAGETALDVEVGDGVYIARIPLSYDLAPIVVSNKPHIKRLGGEATATIKVGNLGPFPSPDYSVVIRQNNQIVATLNGTSLAPQQTQDLSYTLTLTQAVVPLEIEVVANAADTNIENNKLDYVVKILPDYAVRKVELQGGDRLVADIIERKGISAVPVPVKIILVEDGVQSLIASTEYDTNKAEPIIVQSNEFLNKTGAYQVLVQINQQRAVKEDDYSNNKNAINIRRAADLVVSNLEADINTVRVTVRNQGTLPVSSVDLLLTDNPLTAVSTVLPPTPWFYQQNVALGANGEATIVIQRATQSSLQGSTLYAVVNPLGQIPESDRNNNQAKIVIANVDTNPTPGGGQMSMELGMTALIGWCQNIQAELSNTGELAVIAPRVEVLTQAGVSLVTRTLPVVTAGEVRTLTFHGLPFDTYNVSVTYQDPIGQEAQFQQTLQLSDEPGCENTANQDMELVSLQVVNSDPLTSNLLLRITIAAHGYKTNYRKPLVRIPVRIDVKQGTTSYYANNRVLYVPADQGGTGYTFEIGVPRAAFPPGTARVEVQLDERYDERDSANNGSALDVNVEAL